MRAFREKVDSWMNFHDQARNVKKIEEKIYPLTESLSCLNPFLGAKAPLEIPGIVTSRNVMSHNETSRNVT